MRPQSWKAFLEPKRLARLQDIINQYDRLDDLKSGFRIKHKNKAISEASEARLLYEPRLIFLKTHYVEDDSANNLKEILFHEVTHIANDDKYHVVRSKKTALSGLALISESMNNKEKVNLSEIQLTYSAVFNYFAMAICDELSAWYATKTYFIVLKEALKYMENHKRDLKYNLRFYKTKNNEQLREFITNYHVDDIENTLTLARQNQQTQSKND